MHAPRGTLTILRLMQLRTGIPRLAELDQHLASTEYHRHVDFNRSFLQRNDEAIVQVFSDSRPSIAVPFVSARWGSLASFGARAYPGTRRWYGTNGNSFVAVVEFGPRVRAWAVTAGGESGAPVSPHFNDQAGRYASGDLRPVYFYREDLEGHIGRSYHPGQ